MQPAQELTSPQRRQLDGLLIEYRPELSPHVSAISHLLIEASERFSGDEVMVYAARKYLADEVEALIGRVVRWALEEPAIEQLHEA